MKKETRLLVFNKFKGKCAYCGIKIEFDKFNVDHIQAKFRNSTQDELNSYSVVRIKGRDHIDNYNPSCVSCNSSKSTFELNTWRKELELKRDRIKRDSSTYNILVRFGQIKENYNPILFHFEKINKL